MNLAIHWYSLPNIAIQILIMSCNMCKESKQAEIHQNVTRQRFLIRNLPKYSSTKNHTLPYIAIHLPINTNDDSKYLGIIMKVMQTFGTYVHRYDM